MDDIQGIKQATSPDIQILPTALSAALSEGQSTTLSLIIQNNGDSNLIYEINESAPAPVRAAQNAPLSWPTDKVDAQLWTTLENNDQANFLVYLKEQADLDSASQMRSRITRREQVYTSLQRIAQESQAPLLTWLDQQQENGDVTRYHSFFIVNAIAVTGNSKILSTLAQRDDVAYIERQSIFDMPKPELSQPVSAAAINEIEWGIQKIKADQVWSDFSIDGSGVTIGIIDTGVEYTHPALKNQYRGTATGNHDFNWYDPTGSFPESPSDVGGHGTHVTGIMVGSDDSENQIGVAPGAKWIAARACNQREQGGCSSFDLLKALEWMLAPCPIGVEPGQNECDPSKRPNIVSNSWGSSSGGERGYETAVNNLRKAGIVPIFAAGNGGAYGDSTIYSPGDYASTIAVGAVDEASRRANFSSQGPSRITSEIKPDISAPGVDIRSAGLDGKYVYNSGTAMATPHLAGVVALILEANPKLTVEQIETILKNTATDLGEPGPDYQYGYGLVNAYDAVQSARVSYSWISYQSELGTIKPNKSHTIELILNATGLEVGSHEMNLEISSNDSDTPQLTIPVALIVEEAPAEEVAVQISNQTAKRATITWVTNRPTTAEIHYGTNRQELNETEQDVRGQNQPIEDDVHYVTLKNLKPETKYYFQITEAGQSTNSENTIHEFTIGPDIGIRPPQAIYGKVLKDDGMPAQQVLVLLQVIDADGSGSTGKSSLMAGLTNGDGYWVDPSDDSALNLNALWTGDGKNEFRYTAGDKVDVEILGGADCNAKARFDMSDLVDYAPQRNARSLLDINNLDGQTPQKEAPTLSLYCSDTPVNGPLPPSTSGTQVTPDILTAILSEGDSTTLSLTIHNGNETDLTYHLDKERITPAQAAHAPDQRRTPMISGDKINIELQNALKEEENIDFWVYLTEQANVDSSSPASDRAKRGQQTYTTLVETAKWTQDDLLGWLDKQKMIGAVRQYDSYFIINAVAVSATKEIVNELAQRDDVAYMTLQKNFYISDVTKKQRVSDAAVNEISWNISLINADKVWPLGIDGSDVTIGIIDTGVDYTHPALQNQYRGTETNSHDFNWYDPYEISSDVPIDKEGHGTHVAGIIVGSSGVRQIGVAPGATWIAAHACDAIECPDRALLKALEWMLAPCPIGIQPGHESCDPSKRPDIVNNSWGGETGEHIAEEYFYETVIKNLREVGIVPIFAAGNSGPDPKTMASPANYPTTYAVGSVDNTEAVAFSSSRGQSRITSKIKPDFTAPGENIYSSLPGGRYGYVSGTSMASPHVAGTVALMLQADPYLYLDEIEEILKSTAKDLGSLGPDYNYGYGLVDAYAAVQAAGGAAPWLTYNSEEGIIPPGESKDVEMTLNAIGLLSKTHTANVIISFDDPDVADITIPVELFVESAVARAGDVNVSNITSKEGTITWVSNLKTIGEVHYGTNPSQLDQIAHDISRGIRDDIHYVRIRELQPETKYYFRVVTDNRPSETLGDFTTVSTGSVPGIESIYGRVFKPNKKPAQRVLVHLQIVDNDKYGNVDKSAILTGLTNQDGYWIDPTTDSVLNLSSILTLEENDIFKYSKEDKVKITILGGAYCDTEVMLQVKDIINSEEIPALSLSCSSRKSITVNQNWTGLTLSQTQANMTSANALVRQAEKQNIDINKFVYWDSESDDWMSNQSDDLPILPCQGYFIQASEPSLFRMSSGMITSHICDVVLRQGGNLISLPNTASPIHASTACQQIQSQGGDVTEISHWNSVVSDWHSYICNQTFGDFQMVPQLPYFIKSQKSSEWSPEKPTKNLMTYDAAASDIELSEDVNPTITSIRYANIRENSITVIWQTDTPATGQIHFGNQAGELVNIIRDDRGEAYAGTVHQATLTGLRPSTAYHLAIHSGETVDDNAGQFHQVETKPALSIPSVQTAYGQVLDRLGKPAVGAQVYATVSDGASLSAITNTQGYWSLNLGTLRTADGTAYLDVTDGTLAIEVITPSGITGSQSLAIENLTPAPTLVLNEGYRLYLPFITR